MFEKAEEFLKEAKKELIKSGEYQHTITSKLINLMVIDEFKPLWDKFKVGNFVRAGTDRKVYRMRLMSYQIDFDNLENIEVEFSDIAKKVDDSSIINNILSQANSMASSYSSVKHQVDKNKESTNLVKDWVDKGLDLTNMKIISGASNQNFVQNKNGFLIRSYDDVSETYSDEQMKLVNSTLAITDDNWQSIKTAVGKYYYIDPTTGKTKKAYGVNAETIVGKMILGESMGIYSDDGNSSMSFDNKGLIINVNKGVNSQYNNVIDIKIDGVSKFYISRDGDLIINNGKLTAIDADLSGLTDKTNGLIVSLDGFKSEVGAKFKNYSTTAQMNSSITQTAKEINIEVNKKVGKTETISSINQTAETIKINAAKIKLEGIVTANSKFKILTDGSMQATNATISGTISSSTISGGTIKGSSISGGTITGVKITGSTIIAERTRTATVYTSDPDKIKNEILNPGSITSESERDRLDYDRDGKLSAADYAIAKNILSGVLSNGWKDYVYINKDSYSIVVGTETTSRTGFRETKINPGGIFTGDISYNNKSNYNIALYENSISLGYTNKVNINLSDNGITTNGYLTINTANGKVEARDQGLEMYGTTPYIDFHKGFSTADFTSRIVDTGYLELLSLSGGIKMKSGDCVLYLEGNGIGGGRCFRPQGTNNNQIKLGDTYAGWYRLYASLANYTTSDIRKKTNIKEYDSRFEGMYMDLKPITYELISDRGQSHCGFIAQWTKEAMLKHNIADSEFGVYIHEKDNYGMAYEEMVSLNTHMIQRTIFKTNNHDAEIIKLKDEINRLQAKLDSILNNTIEHRRG